MKTQLKTSDNQGPTELSDALKPGDRAGPWIIEYELGRGGMGAVYAVVHEDIGKRAALKVVHGRLLVPGFSADRMLLEAQVVNQIGHPNIVDIFETGRMPDTRPYIVMERLAGSPLSTRADEAKILPDQVIALLLQICDALIAAHAAGVVHRDLKLDNIFLCDNPDDPSTPRVKILDWGIAKVINHDVRHTVEGQLVGTPQYLSPEQARGGTVSAQTDVYSLGVMAYELFLEQLPFEAETSAEVMVMHLRAIPPPARELWPDIPPMLEDLLARMLAKAPHHRPTMLEVAHRLEIVRDELRKRQRKSFVDAATCATVAPVDPIDLAVPQTRSARGIAKMLPIRSRRWQLAAGVAAILVSATVFLVIRSGESSLANASTTSPALDAGMQPVEPIAAPITPPNVVSSMPTAATTPPPVIRPIAVPHGKIRSSKPRVRAAKIDPDGTIDPYPQP